jgi:hypothetical protein
MAIGKKFKRATPRMVPAFTIQALQRDVTVEPPPKAGTYLERPPKLPTQLRRFYLRGDLPVATEFDTYGKNKITWKVRYSRQGFWVEFQNRRPALVVANLSTVYSFNS